MKNLSRIMCAPDPLYVSRALSVRARFAYSRQHPGLCPIAFASRAVSLGASAPRYAHRAPRRYGA